MYAVTLETVGSSFEAFKFDQIYDVVRSSFRYAAYEEAIISDSKVIS